MKKKVIVIILLSFNLLLHGTYVTENYKLKNGLRVILSPDKNTQAVCILLYHIAGVRNNAPDQRGCSFLFKDLMFLGTNNLEPYERLMYAKTNGGISTGRVGYDNSIFYQILPETEINNGLWYEKERISSLNLTDHDINILKNRLYRRIYTITNSNIYFRASHWVLKKIFAGTIYQTPVYGELEQIRNFSNLRIKKNYRHYQNLNNMIMVISGNFISREIKTIINKHFSELQNPIKSTPKKYRSISPRTEYVYDNWFREKLPQNITLFGIRTPSKLSHDYLYFQFIKYYLTDERISKLHNLLNKTYKLDVQIGFETTSNIESNAFILKISSTTRINVERAKYFIRSVFENLRNKAISNSDLKLLKSLIEIDFQKNIANLEMRSIMLAENLHLYGDLNLQTNFLERVRDANVYDIIRIAKKYLKKENQVTLNVYSK